MKKGKEKMIGEVLQKQAELTSALTKVIRVAREQNIEIISISLPVGWLGFNETAPVMFMGLKIIE